MKKPSKRQKIYCPSCTHIETEFKKEKIVFERVQQLIESKDEKWSEYYLKSRECIESKEGKNLNVFQKFNKENRPTETGENFQFVDLSYWRFVNSNISADFLFGADLSYSLFYNCTFESTSFAFCNLTGTNFIQCVFNSNMHFSDSIYNKTGPSFLGCIFAHSHAHIGRCISNNPLLRLLGLNGMIN